MLDSRITDAIKQLTPVEKIALMEFTAALLKQELEKKNVSFGRKTSFAILASEIAESGKIAVQKGAESLPVDFSINHDKYLYSNEGK